MDLYWRRIRFRSRPGHRLVRLKIVVVFASLSRQTHKEGTLKVRNISFQVLTHLLFMVTFPYQLMLYTLNS